MWYAFLVILAIMAFLGIAVCFGMRSCFSIALTEMVKPIENNKVKNHTKMCPAVTLITDNITLKSNITHRNKGTQYSWTQEEQGCWRYDWKNTLFRLKLCTEYCFIDNSYFKSCDRLDIGIIFRWLLHWSYTGCYFYA